MSYKVNSDCTNCGACEPECPNTAITEGADARVINADACTECGGFNAEPMCASVCPTESCVPDEANKETEVALIAKLKTLHPGKTFADPIISHFRK